MISTNIPSSESTFCRTIDKLPRRRTSASVTFFWFFGFCAALMMLTANTAVADDADNDKVVVASLISDLSASKFLVRQRAMNSLVAIGEYAIPQLSAAVRDGDRETRFRAGRVLDAVEQNAFQQKLEQFIKAGVGDVHINLPGWRAFCARISETSESRRVFAQISRAEPRLCRSIEHGPAEVGDEINRRSREIQGALRENRAYSITLGTIAGLLFAAGIDDVKLNSYGVKNIFGLCNQSTFRNELRVQTSATSYAYAKTAKANILRELFADCLMHFNNRDAQLAFSLSMLLNIPQCLPRALELVRNKQTPCYVVQTVMVAVAMFGDKEDIAVLELRVADKSFCGVAQRINNVQYQTQLRDVAIAAMLILAKEDPQQYGFSRIKVFPTGQFNISQVGFVTDEARVKTLSKWEAFRATLKIPRLEGK